MKVQAQISLYPLRRPDLAVPITRFVQQLERDGLDINIGPMSTQVTGDSKVLFGQNLIHGGRGSISVGDPVVVLSNTT